MNHFQIWLKEEGLTPSMDWTKVQFAKKVWDSAVKACEQRVAAVIKNPNDPQPFDLLSCIKSDYKE